MLPGHGSWLCCVGNRIMSSGGNKLLIYHSTTLWLQNVLKSLPYGTCWVSIALWLLSYWTCLPYGTCNCQMQHSIPYNFSQIFKLNRSHRCCKFCFPHSQTHLTIHHAKWSWSECHLWIFPNFFSLLSLKSSKTLISKGISHFTSYWLESLPLKTQSHQP